MLIKRNPEAIAGRKAQVLADQKAAAIADINKAVGEIRLRFITDLPGQQIIYARKESEARTYLALDKQPENLSGFPLLAAEVGLTAPDAYQLAQLWLNMSDQWAYVASVLENARLATGIAVSICQSVEQIEATLLSFTTSMARGFPPG